jgi:hypothetical protein
MAKRRKEPTPVEDLEVLESHLAGTLKPLAPPREIVQRLSKRIQMPNREKIAAGFSDWGRLFLIFGSVISGMLLIITIARALYYLSGRRG